jgi:hypothetical protein
MRMSEYLYAANTRGAQVDGVYQTGKLVDPDPVMTDILTLPTWQPRCPSTNVQSITSP